MGSCDLDHADHFVRLVDSAEHEQHAQINSQELQLYWARALRLQTSKWWSKNGLQWILDKQELSIFDHFTYLRNCVAKEDEKIAEVIMCTSKAGVAYCTLEHLWR